MSLFFWPIPVQSARFAAPATREWKAYQTERGDGQIENSFTPYFLSKAVSEHLLSQQNHAAFRSRCTSRGGLREKTLAVTRGIWLKPSLRPATFSLEGADQQDFCRIQSSSFPTNHFHPRSSSNQNSCSLWLIRNLFHITETTLAQSDQNP